MRIGAGVLLTISVVVAGWLLSMLADLVFAASQSRSSRPARRPSDAEVGGSTKGERPCPRCGRCNVARAAFCAECGERLRAA